MRRDPGRPSHPWRKCFCACLLAHGGGPYERFMAARKQQLFENLQGNVLEIGPGTGVNLPHLPRGVRYTAAEPNPYMHRYLQRAASQHKIELELLAQPFESVDIPNQSIDAIICTLVLCSVDDADAVLQKALHLLRPGGRFIFIEHVAAPPGSWLRALQHALRPVWQVLGDGCHPDRETWRVLEGAGFGSLKYERFRAPLPIVSPHISGEARAGQLQLSGAHSSSQLKAHPPGRPQLS